MTPKVAVFGTLRFPPENIPQVLPHLRTLVETTYANDGCIAYDVAEDPFDPGLIRFSSMRSCQSGIYFLWNYKFQVSLNSARLYMAWPLRAPS